MFLPAGESPYPASFMTELPKHLGNYRNLLIEGLDSISKNLALPRIQEEMESGRKRGATIFLAGNGGSAANANHFATDLIYGANTGGKGAFRVHALSANPSVLTCLGNDTGYENIFAKQLEALAQEGDILLVFSGSGN